jgi:hypothetical protein
MDIKVLPAEFFFDKIGVIIKIELNADRVLRGELVYDGRNRVILNRNDQQFYLLSHIAPMIRKRIVKSRYVTIVESFNDEIMQAYDIAVRIVDQIPGDDRYEEELKAYIADLEQQLGKDRMEELRREALHSFSILDEEN